MSKVRKAISQMRHAPTDIPDLALWVLPPPKGLYNPILGGWSIATLNGSSVGYRMDMSKKCVLGPNVAPATIEEWGVDPGASRTLTGETIYGYPVYEIYSQSGASYNAPVSILNLATLEVECLYQIRVLAKAANGSALTMFFSGTEAQSAAVTLTDEWNWYSSVRMTTVGNKIVELRTPVGGLSSSVYIAAIEIRKIEGNHLLATDVANRPITADSPPSIVYDTVNDNWSTNFADPVAGTMLVATKHGILHTEVDIPAGTWDLYVDPLYKNVGTDFEIVIYNRVLNPDELSTVKHYLTKPEYMIATDFSTSIDRFAWFRGNTYLRKLYLSNVSFTNVTSLRQFIQLSGCQEIVFDGPIDDSLVLSYGSFAANADLHSFDATKLTVQFALSVDYMFSNNVNLTSLDLSTWIPRIGLGSGYRFARNCSSLATVVTTPRLFETDCVNYDGAFSNCVLDQTSVDDIINNLSPSVIARNLRNGLLGLEGGTNATPSYIPKSNIDAMGIMGWKCDANGHSNKTSPTLLDFTDKLTALRPEWVTAGWVYTRNSPKWVLQDGVFVELANNQFGTTWDQEEGMYAHACEKSSTNLFTYSEGDLTTLSSHSNVTLESGILGFDNTFGFGDNNVNRSISKEYASFVSGNNYVASFFLQKTDNTDPSVGNRTINDFYGDLAGVSNVTPQLIEEVYPSIYRVVVTATSAVTGAGTLQIGKLSTMSPSGFKVGGLMLETGTYVSSYIKTLATTVDRSEDVLHLNLTGLTGFSDTDLSVFAESKTRYRTAEPRFIIDVNGTNNVDDRIYIAYSNTNLYASIVRSDGVNNDPFNQPNHPITRTRAMVTLQPTRSAASYTSTALMEDTTCTPPVDLISMHIGSNGVNYQGQPRANIYKAGLLLRSSTDAELTTLTSLTAEAIDNIPDITLWMKASDIGVSQPEDNEQISSWTDKSSNGYVYSQGDSSRRPWHRTNIINGQPVVRFDGNDYMSNPADNPFPLGNGEYCVFAVFAPASDIVSNLFFAGSGATDQAFFLRHQPTLALTDGWWNSNATSPNNSLSIGTFSLVRTQYNAVTGRKLYINSQLVATNTSVTKNTATGTTYIGSQLAGQNAFHGDLAELIICSRDLTPTEITTIESYLKNKYGLPS